MGLVSPGPHTIEAAGRAQLHGPHPDREERRRQGPQNDTGWSQAQWWVELHSASPRSKQLDHSGQVCGPLTAVYTNQAQCKVRMDF